MSKLFRFLLPVAVCVLLAAGCSKPVTPVSGDVGPHELTSFDRHGRGGDKPNRPFLVRLHFVGTVASLDRDFRPHVHERADFFICSEGAPVTLDIGFRDTVPVDAVLKDVRWRRVRHGSSAGAASAGAEYFDQAPDAMFSDTRRPVGDDIDRRTFYEIFADRIYARNGGDAVHLNSWVVFPRGGFDRDSRYVPRIGDPGNTLAAVRRKIACCEEGCSPTAYGRMPRRL